MVLEHRPGLVSVLHDEEALGANPESMKFGHRNPLRCPSFGRNRREKLAA
jgi:hypothetical protein